MRRTPVSLLFALLVVVALTLGGCDLFSTDGGGGGDGPGDGGDGRAAITLSLDAHHA